MVYGSAISASWAQVHATSREKPREYTPSSRAVQHRAMRMVVRKLVPLTTAWSASARVFLPEAMATSRDHGLTLLAASGAAPSGTRNGLGPSAVTASPAAVL